MNRWRWTLALAVTVSVAGNVAYALLTATPAHAIGAAAAAAVAPTMLFLITHNLAAEGRGAAAGWRHRASFVGAWAITLAAFAASYVELHALMILLGRSPVSAVLTPLIVDVAIAVASLRVLAVGVPTAEPSRTRRQSHLRRLADAFTARAEAAIAVPVHRGGAGDTDAATSGDVRIASGASPEPAAVHRADVSRRGDTDAAAHRDAPVRLAVVPRDADPRRIAERVVATGRTTAGVEVVVTVLELLAGGAAQRVAAAQTGLSVGAVQRIVKAAREAAA